MGVSGLLTLLKSIHKPCHLREFKGKTMAVDAYGWLHRGAVACAIELATDKPTTKVLDFAMHRVRMLIHFGVTPYIVFDGDRLPSKAATERGRHERRKEARANGMEYLRVGKVPLAYQELQKAVDITPEIARMFIECLKAANVRYVVAPYEADSQMVYLEQKGLVDGIVSEDSDLLVFGAKRLLTKLDQYGECVMVDKDQFTRCREVNLTGWTNNEFRTMAILSGCDYLDGINRMGLKTAHRLVRKYQSIDRILRGAMLEGKLRIPPNYHQDFLQAERTFLHQWVFCPTVEHLVHFNELPKDLSHANLPFIGECVEADLARQIAEGELNPINKEKIFLTSDQWASVSKHLQRAPLRRSNTTPAVASSKPKETPNSAIEKFFKKRVPLATLDPNAFQPSESQQRLLDSNNEDRDARPTSNLENRPPSVQRSYSVPANRNSVPHPPKRRRLCDDSPSKTAAQTERSKFFGSKPAVEKSPLRVRKSRQKGGQLDFNIFSDDSIAGAMAEFADADIKTETKQMKIKKIEVFCDDDRQHEKHVDDSGEIGHPHAEAVDLPQVKDEADDEASPFSAALRDEAQALRKCGTLQAFAFGNQTSSPKDDAHPSSPCARPHNPRRSTAPAEHLLKPSKPTMHSHPLQTPSKPSTAPDATTADNVIWDSPPTQQRSQEDTQSTTASLKFNTPAWLPEDSGYGSQLDASLPKGSEDWLVQGSSSELGSSRRGSEDVCVAGSSPVKGEDEGEGRMLDLGRFAFGG